MTSYFKIDAEQHSWNREKRHRCYVWPLNQMFFLCLMFIYIVERTHTHTPNSKSYSLNLYAKMFHPCRSPPHFPKNINETQPFSPQRYFAPLIVVTRTQHILYISYARIQNYVSQFQKCFSVFHLVMLLDEMTDGCKQPQSELC